jgi:hypothetical protein
MTSTPTPDEFGMVLTAEEREQMDSIIANFKLDQEDRASPVLGAESPDAGAGAPDGGVDATSSVAPPASTGYQLGDIFVEEGDAPTIAQIYTFLRNNPHRAAEMIAVMQTPPPAPAWQAPVAVQPVTPVVPVVGIPGPPPGLDLDDPSTRALWDRQQAQDAQIAQLLAAQAAQTAQTAQVSEQNRAQDARTAETALIEQNVQAGIGRFKALHPDISDEDFGAINNEAAALNVVPGLATRMPWDQAITQALELVYARRALQQGVSPTTTPANATRKATLTALGSPSSGGGAAAAGATPPPSPGGRAAGSPFAGGRTSQRPFDRTAALALIEQSGAPLGQQI